LRRDLTIRAARGFCGGITLVDDSLRSQRDGAFFDAVPFDPAGSILSKTEQVISAERRAIQCTPMRDRSKLLKADTGGDQADRLV
jgi:hypothetical protein